MKKNIFLTFLFSLIFTVLVILYYTNNIYVIDNFFYKLIISCKSTTFTNFFKIITIFGGLLISLILSDIILIINRKKGIYFLINVVATLTINTIFKSIFMRSRPSDINLIVENGYSFPSAHAMITVSVYGLLLLYICKSKCNNFMKYLCIGGIIILMVLIPLSRVYLGVHYFSDVLAGVCLSAIWLIAYSKCLKNKNIF